MTCYFSELSLSATTCLWGRLYRSKAEAQHAGMKHNFQPQMLEALVSAAISVLILFDAGNQMKYEQGAKETGTNSEHGINEPQQIQHYECREISKLSRAGIPGKPPEAPLDSLPVLTFLLLVCRLNIHSVEREAGFSRNGKVSDSQGVHLFLPLAPGAAL